MITKVIQDLENNKVGVIPTETVLGLCTSFDNELGIKKIYDLKQRPLEKRLSLIFENFDQITNNFDLTLNRKFKLLAWNFWPGPLTIVVKDQNNMTWGFRKPDHEITLFILSKLAKPLACTSVNITNKKPALKISEIATEIKSELDFIIDCDANGLYASTVYDLDNDLILRKGPISLEQIHQVLKND